MGAKNWGEKIGAFGLTEPGAGSDAAAIEAKAVRNGDNYVLNGTKTFISNAPICDFAIIPAYTDKSLGPGKGISVFVIEKDMVGFSSSPKLEKMGNHSDETGSLYLRDCRVPASNLVGEEGRGFQYIMKGLTRGRIVHAARTLGVAVAAYESALDYAKQRVQFNQPIGKFQAISFRLARMALEIESVRWLIYRAAWLYDNGKKCNKESSMAKLLSSEVALRVADNATHIFGGYGYIAEYQVERYFRDAKIGVITQGTSEVQHILIARELGL
jgi:alkylation response protein AidB-like acyl-CoA dehydrogenase